jgi:hypothetical protein
MARKRQRKTASLGEQIVAWIETNCRVPEGALVGQPIRLMGGSGTRSARFTLPIPAFWPASSSICWLGRRESDG